MKTTAAVLSILALGLASCLENEEEITVAPDGSVEVLVRAKGPSADLADGYPVPLHAPWAAEGARKPGEADDELFARARFASAREVPRFLAPASEPYATAYLERATALGIERKGGRTVYTFERRYVGRVFERVDLLSAIHRGLGDDTFGRVEESKQLTEEERAKLVDAAVAAMRVIPRVFARDALLALYVQGDASLPAGAVARIDEGVRAAVDAVVQREVLDRIARGMFPLEGERDADEAIAELEQLDRTVRETLRASFARAIEAEGAPLATRNALRGELEWLLTARDHTEDLGDESFTVRVRMPGTIVGGDFDAIEGEAATWRIDGKDLRDRDRVLRVVSVVE